MTKFAFIGANPPNEKQIALAAKAGIELEFVGQFDGFNPVPLPAEIFGLPYRFKGIIGNHPLLVAASFSRGWKFGVFDFLSDRLVIQGPPDDEYRYFPVERKFYAASYTAKTPALAIREREERERGWSSPEKLQSRKEPKLFSADSEEVGMLIEGLRDVEDLIHDSYGVTGTRKDGEAERWKDLQPHWLEVFERAVAIADGIVRRMIPKEALDGGLAEFKEWADAAPRETLKAVWDTLPVGRILPRESFDHLFHVLFLKRLKERKETRAVPRRGGE